MPEEKPGIILLNGGADFYGSGKILLEVARHLVQADFSVFVILPHDGPIAPAFSEVGAQVKILNLGILRRKYFNPIGLLTRMILWAYGLLTLGLYIRKNNINIIYSNTLSVLIGSFLARLVKRPHIWHVHEILPDTGIMARFYRFWFRRTSSHFVAVSEAVKKRWVSLIQPPSTIEVIHNGLKYPEALRSDLNLRNELHLPPVSQLVGMVGRVHAGKGQDYLLDILHRLRERLPDLHLIIVGDAYPGNEHLVDAMLAKVNELGLEKRVHYLGYREDVSDILLNLDLFILPSTLPDSFPTVILEAMSHEIAVMATKSGGAEEMLEQDISGVLVPWDDVDLVAGEMESLLRNGDKRRAMAIAGRKRVRDRFSETAFASRTVANIREKLRNNEV